MPATPAPSAEWGVEPSTLVAVYGLVRDVQEALGSKATSSWSAERRKAVEDMLDRLTALMRELAQFAGYEDGGGDARHHELLHRRLELLVAGGRALIDRPATAPAARPLAGGAADARI